MECYVGSSKRCLQKVTLAHVQVDAFNFEVSHGFFKPWPSLLA